MNAFETLAAALLLAAGAAAAVSAVTVRAVLERVPGAGTVRLAELTADYMARAAREDGDREDAAEAVREWAGRIDEALARTAARHRVVLHPAGAVAAGAKDFTAEVKAAMREAARKDKAPARPGDKR